MRPHARSVHTCQHAWSSEDADECWNFLLIGSHLVSWRQIGNGCLRQEICSFAYMRGILEGMGYPSHG
jgi:hypothetical protein